MGRKKEEKEEDKVLKFAVTIVVVLFIIGMMIVGVKLMNPRVDASVGKKKLEKLEEADVRSIDAKIQELETEETEADIQWREKSADEKMEGCLVLGDAMSQGLYQYEVLGKGRVMTKDNAGVCDPDGTGMTELVDKAVEADPQKLFLAIGRSDVAGERDAKAFAGGYESVLKKLKEALPNTDIYVNSIFPVRKDVLEEAHGYKNIDEYNQKLKELCKSQKVMYIDNTELITDEDYAENGIYMAQGYYEKWVNHMLEAAFRRNGIQ